jgi:hypothetical protein
MTYLDFFSCHPLSSKFALWVTDTVPPLARKQLEAQGIKVVKKMDGCIGMMDGSRPGVLWWFALAARLLGRQENRPIDWATRVVMIIR